MLRHKFFMHGKIRTQNDTFLVFSRMTFYFGDFGATSSTHVALNEEKETNPYILQCVALKSIFFIH